MQTDARTAAQVTEDARDIVETAAKLCLRGGAAVEDVILLTRAVTVWTLAMRQSNMEATAAELSTPALDRLNRETDVEHDARKWTETMPRPRV